MDKTKESLEARTLVDISNIFNFFGGGEEVSEAEAGRGVAFYLEKEQGGGRGVLRRWWGRWWGNMGPGGCPPGGGGGRGSYILSVVEIPT